MPELFFNLQATHKIFNHQRNSANFRTLYELDKFILNNAGIFYQRISGF